jgi:ATP-binding cassette subfamily F protein uup
MSLLRAHSLTRLQGSRTLLDAVDFSIEADQKVGLIGANGTGKSTLLHLLVGLDTPDEGRIEIARGALVRLLPQEPRLDPNATVGELLRAGQVRRQALERELDELHEALSSTRDEREIQALLEAQGRMEEHLRSMGGSALENDLDRLRTLLRLPPLDARAGSLSGGEARRTALARALIEQPDLLLLDEPTNHLDQEGIEWVEQTLQSWSGAFVLVTHDRALLDACVSHVFELDRGKLYESFGNYTDYLEQRAERLEREAKAEDKRRAFLRRELDWIRRGPAARTTKAKARVDRFRSAESAVPIALPGDLALEFPPGPRLGTRGIVAKKVGHGFGSRRLFRNVELELGAGERLGLIGPNGSGKTTLLRILVGELAPQEGAVEIGASVRFSRLPQDLTGIDPRVKLIDFVAHANDRGPDAPPAHTLRSFLERLLFRPDQHETELGKLSGGERRRAQIARLLRERGNVLVLDEPTNDLDLPTLRVLEEALLTFPGTVLLISHDRWFLERVATRILAIEPAGGAQESVVVDYPGGYAQYVERRAARAAEAAAAAKQAAERAARAAAAEKTAASAPKKAKLTWAEQKDLEALPARLEQLETRIAELEASLAAPELYRSIEGNTKAKELTAELAKTRAETEAAYARWELLESRQRGES